MSFHIFTQSNLIRHFNLNINSVRTETVDVQAQHLCHRNAFETQHRCLCSCYISSMKRIIFEVVFLPSTPKKNKEKRTREFVSVICLKTLHSIGSECILMLLMPWNETTHEKRYFCINLQLALFISPLDECARFENRLVIWYFSVFIWWKWYPLNEIIILNWKRHVIFIERIFQINVLLINVFIQGRKNYRRSKVKAIEDVNKPGRFEASSS